MSTRITVNLPVKDLTGSARFFAQLGFPSDKRLANEIPDTAATSEAILQLQVDSRQHVELADKAFAAGALPANQPNDQGFLYGRSFRDPDGHHWDVCFLDPATAEKQA